ncbi:PTS sugar transporter subunit IIA, partial [Lacticaseibacillus paracasei]|uniref:PTS sugar transporter subunit IIA n=1 Tax=Lacticaseibacillus paracasei TaxID=1597 RepID=UPI0005EBBD0C
CNLGLKLYQPISFSRELQVQVLLMIAPVDNLQHRRAVQAFYDCVIKPANRNELFKLQTSKEIKAFFLKKIG